MRTLTDQERNMFEVFIAQNYFCWSCGVDNVRRRSTEYTPGIDYPRDLENHHIVGASGRVHIRQNLSRLCTMCHDLVEGDCIRSESGDQMPRLTLENVLWLKMVFDPDWYDPSVIERLRHQAVDEPLRPPIWFETEFTRFRLKGYPC